MDLELNGFYWYCYSAKSHVYASGPKVDGEFEGVCTTHPFEHVDKLAGAYKPYGKIVLINWKPITKAEFNLHEKLQNEKQ